jgi:hypothetical protein
VSAQSGSLSLRTRLTLSFGRMGSAAFILLVCLITQTFGFGYFTVGKMISFLLLVLGVFLSELGGF